MLTPGDLRFALRQIARTPLLSAVVVTVIALGIGINAGLLTVLHFYAWRPAPGIAPDPRLARLMALAPAEGGGMFATRLSYPEVQDLREQHRVFSDVAAWGWTSVPADFGGGAETVLAFQTTANYFNVLRVALAAGSGFPEGVDRSPAPIAVISHSLWMSRYDGSPAAVGQTVRIMNVPFTIIGVAPPRFTGTDAKNMGRPAVWIPLGARAVVVPASRDVGFLETVVRLAPGIEAGEVGRLTGPFSTGQARAFRAERLTGFEWEDGGTREFIAAVFIVAGLIVLITCTNVSALLLGRAVARRREVAVRLALGATRGRIVRQMLTESLVYAAGGALLALALYAAAIQVAYATLPGIIYGLQPTPATFLAAAALALLTTLAFGLAPALHASRAGIGEVIKNSGALAARRSRIQAAFVVIQLAASQPVLVVTGLVLGDLLRGVNDRTAHAPASVVTMSADLWRSLPVEDSAAAATLGSLDRIRRRLTLVPGVEFAAVTADAGGEVFEGGAVASARQVHVSADYFAARGIPVVRGRAIGVAEDRRGSAAVVVSEAGARRLWLGADPIGRPLVRRTHGPAGEESTTFEVVGVAGRAPDEGTPAPAVVFVPLSNAASVRSPVITLRTAGDARPLVPQIRAAVREVEPLAALGNVATLAERSAESRSRALQANAAAFAVGAAALLLASLGLYAIIAFAVAQRTREIGVRLAIGASPGGVVRHFLRDGLKVSALGLAIGVPVTVAGVRMVQANLAGFTPRMVAAVLVVVPVLLAVAALASWLPARRAGRLDPLVALRAE